MTINPLAAGSFRGTNNTKMQVNTRSQLDDLQRQLATGKKSLTYGGLGPQRFTSLDFRAKAADVKGYQETITQLQIRVKQLNVGLTAISNIGDEVRRSSILPQFDPDGTGQTSIQKFARPQLDQAIDILNEEVNGVRIYAGRKTDVRPVLDSTTILEGDAAGRAGVRQFIAERKTADYGTAPNIGRLIQGGGGTTATLTEENAPDFGMKLTAATSSSAAITTTLTVGPPANLSFNVASNPVDGDQVRFELTMPDGSKQNVILVAKTGPLSPTGSAGQFEIGATPAATAANLRLAISAAVTREATTSLPASSAKAAADAFFAGSPNNPPMRVPAPAATATALVAGTAANSVIWYQGDDQSPVPRQTTQAKIDSGQVVNVGVQANETGIQRVLSALAVGAVETFTTAAADKGRHQAMIERIRDGLANTPGVQSVQSILVEVAVSSTTMKGAEERHKVRLGFVESIIADVEDSNQEETASKLLALQTKLQAAYQTTSILSRLNLTEYLR